MCAAARTTIVQVRQFVKVGDIDPEEVVTPGIYVKRLVVVPEPVQESVLIKEGCCYP
jgi:3-oxoadipate CoA-transferase alpha subunit